MIIPSIVAALFNFMEKTCSLLMHMLSHIDSIQMPWKKAADLGLDKVKNDKESVQTDFKIATKSPKTEKSVTGFRAYVSHTKESFSFLWPAYRNSWLGRGNRYKYTLPIVIAGATAVGVAFPLQAFGLGGMIVMAASQAMKDNKHVRPMFSIGSLLFAADLYLKGPAGWAGAFWSGGAAVRASLFGMTSENNTKARAAIGIGIAGVAISSIVGLAVFVPSFSLTFLNCLPILGIAGGAFADSRRSKDSDASRFSRFIGGPPVNLVYHILGSGSVGASINGVTNTIALGSAIYKYDMGRMRKRHPERSKAGILKAYLAEVLIKSPTKVFFSKETRKQHEALALKEAELSRERALARERSRIGSGEQELQNPTNPPANSVAIVPSWPPGPVKDPKLAFEGVSEVKKVEVKDKKPGWPPEAPHKINGPKIPSV